MFKSESVEHWKLVDAPTTTLAFDEFVVIRLSGIYTHTLYT